jgi:hypothetical protein
MWLMVNLSVSGPQENHVHLTQLNFGHVSFALQLPEGCGVIGAIQIKTKTIELRTSQLAVVLMVCAAIAMTNVSGSEKLPSRRITTALIGLQLSESVVMVQRLPDVPAPRADRASP